MKECCQNECSCSCCSNKNDSCHEQEQDECCKSDFFLEIADCAWTEVLKDKIKEYILSTQSERMKELAKIVAEGNNQRWKNKMAKENGCREFEEKLCCFFSQHKE
jgi:hypothetical protein